MPSEAEARPKKIAKRSSRGKTCSTDVGLVTANAAIDHEVTKRIRRSDCECKSDLELRSSSGKWKVETERRLPLPGAP
jgi:hypothetical protein